jgi:starch-binding outer membrane protein, SusD/RagB family
MKTIKYILTGMLVLLTACSKDFVNLTNPNLITSSYFWKTSDDAVMATNSMYQALIVDGTYMRKYPWTMDVRSDDSYNMTPYTYVMSNLTNYTIGGEEVEQPWECNYVGIWRANQVLDNIGGIDMDESLRNRCLGEAHFIRGLCYFNLLNLYKYVVVYEHAAQSVDDFYIPQSDPEDVWALVYQDFTDAISGCWLKNDPNNEIGRATKAAAAAFLAKAYLMNGRFSDAEPVLKDIIDGTYGPYSLVPTYLDNFTEDNENNAESVFEIQYDENVGGSTQGWIGNPSPDWSKTDGYNKSLGPSGAPINCWGDVAPSLWIWNEFQQEKTVSGKIDTRMEESLFFYHPDSAEYLFYGIPQDSMHLFGYATTGRTDLGVTDTFKVWIKKNVYGDRGRDAIWLSGINRRLVRYADILLLYAECLNEAGNTTDAYSYIQQVRDRAKLPDLATVKPGMTQAEMREQIAHERALELCFETWRYIDLLRWGWFTDPAKLTMLKQHDPEFDNYITGREYLAIPPTEIDRTNGIVHQNPAWN